GFPRHRDSDRRPRFQPRRRMAARHGGETVMATPGSPHPPQPSFPRALGESDENAAPDGAAPVATPAREWDRRPPGWQSGVGTDASALVQMDNVSIAFPDESGERLIPVVEDVSLEIRRHEILGLVGESGSGKTQTALTILGLTRAPGQVIGGRVVVDGEDVGGMDDAALRRVLGERWA